MSTIKSSSEHLVLNADGASKDIKFQANGVEKASISSAGALTIGSMNWSSVSRGNSVSQSIPASTVTVLVQDTSFYDTLSEMDAAGRFTATAAGTYHITVNILGLAVAWSANNEPDIEIKVNGTTKVFNRQPFQAAVTTRFGRSMSGSVKLAANDYVEVTLNTPVAFSTQAGTQFCNISIDRTA